MTAVKMNFGLTFFPWQLSGSFDTKCQEVSTDFILCISRYGVERNKHQNTIKLPQPRFSLTDIELFGTRRREDATACDIKHNQERETPLPIYLGVMVHMKTCKRDLEDTLYDLGLSVSYDRVLHWATERRSLHDNSSRQRRP